MYCLRATLSKAFNIRYERWTTGYGWKRLCLPLRKEGPIAALSANRIFRREIAIFYFTHLKNRTVVTGMNRKTNKLILLIITALIVIVLGTAVGCNEKTGVGEEAGPERFIHLSTTTSSYDSGLLDYINPVFTEQTGITVRVISLGTGAALETGRRGDADVLLVHDRDAELALVEEGYFVNRFDLMYNDFIVVGPADDPAKIKNAGSIIEACALIAGSEKIFVSRGDSSGTHRMEENLWKIAEIETAGQDWYYSIGQGMGETLRFAHEILGYTLTDRGTYEALKTGLELEILYEEDPLLYNYYGVMAVNPDLHPHVRFDDAMEYIHFLTSPRGRELIKSYRINGTAIFLPIERQ